MNTTINMDTDIDQNIEKVKTLLKYLSEVQEKSQKIQFVSIKEIAAATGWSEGVVQDIFNKDDFPCCDYGKEKKAEVEAVRKWFSVPRRKFQ